MHEPRPQPGLAPEAQHAFLARNAEEILPAGALRERLEQVAREGRPLRVKQGFDPTAPHIHLGHTVGLRKLREFQDLGHQVVLILGDYTGMVGDPSGRNRTRPQLSAEAIEDNARTYLEQFYRVLDPHPAAPRLPVEVRRNGEWFARMSFAEILRLLGTATISQMLEREDFSARFQQEQPISLHELMYPLMQGWDSVRIAADVEIGGTDQKFNLIMGRELQRGQGQTPQVVLTMPLIPGLDGAQKMSKSLGNTIDVEDPPGEMYGRAMRMPDGLIVLYARLTTDMSADEVGALERALAGGNVNPMESKKQLAHRLVTMYHGREAADRAAANFTTQFSRREIPDELATWQADAAELGIKDLLVRSGLARTGSEAWRAVDHGAVRIDQVKVTDRNHRQSLAQPFVLQLGRRMIRVQPGGGSAGRG